MTLTANYLLQKRSLDRWTGGCILRMPANLCPSARLQVTEQLPIHVPPVSRMAALNGQHIRPLPPSLIQSTSLLSAQPLQSQRPMWSPQYCAAPPCRDSIDLCKNQYCFIPPSLPACLCHIWSQKVGKRCSANPTQEIHVEKKVSQY